MRLFDMVTGARKLKEELPVSQAGQIIFFDEKKVTPSLTAETLPEIAVFSTGDTSSGNLGAKTGEVISVDLSGSTFQKLESSAVEAKPEAVTVVMDGGAPVTTANDGSITVRDFNAPLWQQRVEEAASKVAPSEPAITDDKQGGIAPQEAELQALLEKVKEVPVIERPSVLQEISKLKQETGLQGLDAQKRQAITEKKKAYEVARKEKAKDQAGIKILQEESRIEALKKNIATIGQDIKNIDDQIAHKEPQASAGRRLKKKTAEKGEIVLEGLMKQGADLKAKAGSFEERLKDSEQARQEAVNIFLSLDGSEEQIDELIRDNIAPEDKTGESVTIEPSDVAKEVASAIPEAMSIGVGLVDIVGEKAVEGMPTQAGIETAPSAEAEKNLDEKITEARLAYVEKDVSITNQWERLKRSFTWLEKTEDPDLVMLRDQYRALLTQKKEAEITRIGLLDETARAQEMLELGIYFKVAEGATLGNLYAEKEKETLSGKLGSILDRIGEKYNRLSITKKVVIGVALLGGSMALAATSGAGIAVGAVAVRRFCAGLGGAVTLDAAAEKFFSGRQEKKMQAETADFIEQEKWTSSPELMKRFDAFLALENDRIDKQVEKKRTKTFFRKWSLRVGGAFGGVALTEYLSSIREAKEVMTVATDTALASGVEVPLSVDTPITSPVLPDQVGSGTPDTSVTEGIAPGATEAIPKIPIAPTPTIPESYTLSASDSKQGLWGVLEKSLPTELDEVHKNKAITSLQNLIAAKLEDMSPEDRAAAGFRSGNVNTIYAGDTLKLDGLVSQIDLQEIIEGKVIDPPVAEVAVPTPLEVTSLAEPVDAPALATAEMPQLSSLESIGDGVDTLAAVSTPDNLLDQLSEGSLIDSDTSGEPVDGTAKLLGEGGVERAVYYKELENTRRSIFATNDLRFRDSILNAPKVKMTDIILAAKVPGETLVENQALFGTDQIARMNRFKELAVNAYGKIAEPGSRETVADYTRRMVTLGFESEVNKVNLDKLARV